MSELLTTEQAYERAVTKSEITLPNGKTAYIKVKEATLEEIEAFEEREQEEAETELVQSVFDEYIVEPEGLNAKKIPTGKLEAIMAGVFKAWGIDESDLDEFIEERQGN
jgi:hypothetical protein